MEIISIPAITILCAFIGSVWKNFTSADNKHIPTVCGTLGLILGLGSFFLFPGFIPAENALVAAAIGVVSGLASTGAHQLVKQQKEG